MKIAWITTSEPKVWQDYSGPFPYVSQDDSLVYEALLSQGHEVEVVLWPDLLHCNLSGFDRLVWRSPWDYSYKFSVFKEALGQLDPCLPWVNPLSLVQWNMNKSYMIDLQDRGLQVIPSQIFDFGFDFHGFYGVKEVVIKPCMGAGGRGVFRIKKKDYASFVAQHVQDLIIHPYMVQPLISEIQDGEYSFIFLAGKFSHAVLKKPPKGEFRAQLALGAEVKAYVPTVKDLSWVEQQYHSIPELQCASFVRIDWVMSASGPKIMEIEAFEPNLFFKFHSGAVAAFIQALTA